jgi:hypothetical protein
MKNRWDGSRTLCLMHVGVLVLIKSYQQSGLFWDKN